MTDRAYWAFTSSSLSQQASEFPVYGFIRDQLIFQPMVYQVHSLYTVVLNGGQVGGIPNLALNSILMVLVHLNVHQ